MHHTRFPLTPFADGSYAKCYTGDVAHPQEVTNSLASGGAYSTPTDLSVLATMLTNGGVFGGTRILSSAAVAEMGTDQTARSFDPAPSDFVRYGLGWDTRHRARPQGRRLDRLDQGRRLHRLPRRHDRGAARRSCRWRSRPWRR